MIDKLTAEYESLVLPRFAETDAMALGRILVELSENLPVVINIRTADRCLFHAALPGAAPLNDTWVRRKSNTALMFHTPSLLVGERNRIKSESLEKHGLSLTDYADHGGAVPIRVAGVGVVACATVSGLPQLDDHALVVRAIRAFLAG
jgi:uncharacterized protein (UPF0303 family)